MESIGLITTKQQLLKKEFIALFTTLVNDGISLEDIAERFGIESEKFEKWVFSSPELRSIFLGKSRLLNSQVEKALFEAAIGSITKRTKVITRFDDEGEEVVFSKEVQIEEKAPDAKAAIFWLQKNYPEKWGEKAQNIKPPIIVVKKADIYDDE